MFLDSISLRNIRSYSKLDLSFERGRSLLSGDIGAGKSTVLLGVEFALFGLMKGMLSGGALLRHGEKEGSVRLSFSVGNDSFSVFRSLKRTSSGIVQDSGYLEFNGERKDYTAVELKSRVLSILGYPDELLSKSKSLIFRYTVYTPQEDMKKIIFDSEEERLEKLTKIFNVEKYKRVRENAELYAKELRAETKIFAVVEAELSSLKEQMKKYELDMDEKNILLQQISLNAGAEETKIKIIEDKLKQFQESIKEFNILKQEIHILEVEKNNLLRNSVAMKNDLLVAESQYNRILDDLKKDESKVELRKLDEIIIDLKKYKELKSDTENKLVDYKSKISLITKKLDDSEKVKKNILVLTKCPTCQQNVDESHKGHIVEDEDKKMRDLLEKKSQALQFLDKAEKNMKIITGKIESFDKELLEFKEYEQKLKFRERQEVILKETDSKILNIKSRLKTIDEDLVSNDELYKKLKAKLVDVAVDEDAVRGLNEEYKLAKGSYLNIKMSEASIIQSIKEIDNVLKYSVVNIEKKKLQLEGLQKKKNIEHWLSNHFVNLVDVIEKNVLSSIRAEFKGYFEEWFNMLIEDESISATLDEHFSPVISQNGYDADVDNLSGGEKTSVALAYRLALNKVINDMLSSIKTKDLLILDEPTDGFSSHQLDKVRDVLDALNSRQTIIVSHESKIESFVDHIIRIRKHEHSSEVL